MSFKNSELGAKRTEEKVGEEEEEEEGVARRNVSGEDEKILGVESLE